MPFLFWFKRWFLDGWLTTGPQLGLSPTVHMLAFGVCLACHRVLPHWEISMTAAESKRRGYLGCRCGCIRVAPAIIPVYKSVWFYFIRGLLIRRLILKARLWDPRMPIMFQELR